MAAAAATLSDSAPSRHRDARANAARVPQAPDETPPPSLPKTHATGRSRSRSKRLAPARGSVATTSPGKRSASAASGALSCDREPEMGALPRAQHLRRPGEGAALREEHLPEPGGDARSAGSSRGCPGPGCLPAAGRSPAVPAAPPAPACARRRGSRSASRPARARRTADRKEARGSRAGVPSNKRADFVARVTALACDQRLGGPAARPERRDEMRAVEQAARLLPPRARRGGEPGERLVERVVARGDPFGHTAQVRNPANTSYRSGV